MGPKQLAYRISSLLPVTRVRLLPTVAQWVKAPPQVIVVVPLLVVGSLRLISPPATDIIVLVVT